MNSDLKLPPESDTDSIADYADGENTGKLAFRGFEIQIQTRMCRSTFLSVLGWAIFNNFLRQL